MAFAGSPQASGKFNLRLALSSRDAPIIIVAVVISCLMAIAPMVRSMGTALPFDRVLDGILIALIGAVSAEWFLTRGWRLHMPLGTTLFILFFCVCALIGFFGGEFRGFLFAIEAKVLIYSLALMLFSNRRMSQHSARLTAVILTFGFVVGLIAFAAIGTGRLTLINESNYTLVGGALILLSLLKTFAIRHFSWLWLAVVAIFVLACLLAQSRTGWALLLAYLAFSSVAGTKNPVAIILVSIAAVLVMVFGAQAIQLMSRGAIGGSASIDRFVFLDSYVSYFSQNILQGLFKPHVGVFLDAPVGVMHWWVLKESVAKDIPYALAPFNFHSGILRAFAAFGLVPGAFALTYLILMARHGGHLLMFILATASISMSIFHLSSVAPIIALAVLMANANRNFR